MNSSSQDVPQVAAESGQAAAPGPLVEPAPVRQSAGARLWRAQRPLLTEAALVVSMYMLYSWTRSAAPDRVALAFRHADLVEYVQRSMGIDFELQLNQLFLRHLWLADAASYWYQIAHMVVTFGTLIWLWWRRRPQYGVQRTSLVFLWLAGLTTYWLFPLAPPRFALDGAVDTMAAHPVLFAGQESVTGLANLYAAMPSLHVGWSTWVALSIVVTNRSPWRFAAWLYPCTMTFVVMGTANHYLLDAVAGATYAVVCWWLARLLYARYELRRASRSGAGPLDLLETA